MMVNEQPTELVDRTEDSVEVFDHWLTIQGEGPYVGMQAIFIRLAGCNLNCMRCDTDYTSKRSRIPTEMVADWCDRQKPGLVVITGGEPFRQKGLRKLCMDLERRGKTVQIETNGTYFQEIPRPLVTVVCSPKTPKIDHHMASRIDAWKYVLRYDAVDPDDGLPTSALGMPFAPARPTNHREIYLQPCDDQDPEINKKNLEAVLESCSKYGYRLCLQIQKIVNMP